MVANADFRLAFVQFAVGKNGNVPIQNWSAEATNQVQGRGTTNDICKKKNVVHPSETSHNVGKFLSREIRSKHVKVLHRVEQSLLL
jgi:hypothetical protein